MTNALIEELTAEERDMILHALGLNRKRESYRNNFVTDEGGPDAAVWGRLVDRGLAIQSKYWGAENSFVYRVTEAGIALIKARSL